jgi:hypothetical protein
MKAVYAKAGARNCMVPGLFVSDDVFCVAGSYFLVSNDWKDSVRVAFYKIFYPPSWYPNNDYLFRLPGLDDDHDAEAKAITVSDGVFYVGGSFSTDNTVVPCYWRDGVRVDLPTQ